MKTTRMTRKRNQIILHDANAGLPNLPSSPCGMVDYSIAPNVPRASRGEIMKEAGSNHLLEPF